MIENALQFLLHTLLGLFTLALLLRFYLQLTRAPFQNPVSQAVIAVTNFVVKPVRRIIPGIAGLDASTLLLAFIAQLLLQIGSLWIRDFPLLVAGNSIWIALAGLAFVGLLKLSIYIFLYAVLLQAILSWINPYTIVTPVLDALTRPLIRPLRNRIPAAGGFDLTPLVVFIVAQLLLIMVITPMEQQLLRLF
ncbi:YggT family protein [Methylobacillus rhizosphaerae]|uniref:YggT family protein n=1 Tax=Methylobacillus rhizosphaerae TaxID=551994 RepID=A0A238Y3Y0_9PROT|nr:YggT family protein [Methylobacillus rhizosphaerae]SNR65915.1 YggT family protein [Methylobacillus rhizosphaerae]